jgi:hypothetical protein
MRRIRDLEKVVCPTFAYGGKGGIGDEMKLTRNANENNAVSAIDRFGVIIQLRTNKDE